MRGRRWTMWVLAFLCMAQGMGRAAHAGGPRFVGGTDYCCWAAGRWMTWYTMQPMYYTDPGALSAVVNHTQADAMVAAAANVWNVPTAAITLARGGALQQHVDGNNTYFNGSAVVFPSDVQAANYIAKQIAVIYDTDGSVTDTMLGGGASDPAGCRQTGVTESVDSFGNNGTIQHAVIVLNGRCVASAAQATQQILQMQYQLTRAFGRVLGLAWSQLNDNVFTGVPTPNMAQMQHWPLMHPIDVICGPYTYQCMVNSSTLRPDDLAALALLYPVTGVGGGKTPSLANGVSAVGFVYFPDGQGMEDVNVAVHRAPQTWGTSEDWEEVSGVTGIYYQQNGGNPVTGGPSPSENVGLLYPDLEARFYMGVIPVAAPWTSLGFVTQPINPLYSKEFAIGPYERAPVAMSGSVHASVEPFDTQGVNLLEHITMSDAPMGCNTGGDGSQANPAAEDPSGWWTGTMCPTGHSAWWTAAVKANRTFTIETTALDETGAATVQKMQPVIGIWDATGMVGAAGSPLNGLALGLTELPMPSFAKNDTILIAVADRYGAGRPDFAYKTRVLYADSVAPATVGRNGGQITITGMGFRQGNQVTVNGVSATAISWTATQIVATVPSMALADPTGAPVDVAVVDAKTGGSTVMQGALVYTGAGADGVKLVSAPPALETGLVAATPFAVRVTAADGVTAAKGASVRFAVTSGKANLGCGAGTSCLTTTDATGLAQTTLAGVAVGTVTVSATEVSGGESVSATMADKDPVRAVSIAGGAQYLAAGASGQWSVPLVALQDAAPAAGVAVAWTASAGSGLTLTPAMGTTSASGTATVTVGVQSVAGGSVNTVSGCAWTTVCASWTLHGVDAALWAVSAQSGAGQSVPQTATLGTVELLVTDGAGHALPGATVTVHQTVYAWEGVCGSARCPAAPVLATATAMGMSDGNGLLDVTPLEVKGMPETVQIAAAAGKSGFVTLTLVKVP